jgi:tetratricopeptide (TPR) repeat protein
MATQFDWRRALLYGIAVPIGGALLWSRFCWEPLPEFGQLLSQINANLRLANSIPATDSDGKPVPAREQMLAAAERDITIALRCDQVSAVLAEFEGFAKSLRGDYVDAAACYRRAQSMPDCSDEQRAVLAFNEARMLRRTGKLQDAMSVLEAAQPRMTAGYAEQCMLERAEIAASMSRNENAENANSRSRALELLTAVMRSDRPVAWLQAGDVYASLGANAEADAAWARASSAVPIADGRRARLKLAEGDADTALQLFERAAIAAPAEMRRLVREDPAAWQAIAEDARYRQLVDSSAAAPVR